MGVLPAHLSPHSGALLDTGSSFHSGGTESRIRQDQVTAHLSACPPLHLKVTPVSDRWLYSVQEGPEQDTSFAPAWLHTEHRASEPQRRVLAARCSLGGQPLVSLPARSRGSVAVLVATSSCCLLFYPQPCPETLLTQPWSTATTAPVFTAGCMSPSDPGTVLSTKRVETPQETGGMQGRSPSSGWGCSGAGPRSSRSG